MKISFLSSVVLFFIPFMLGLVFFIGLYSFKNKRFIKDKFKIFNCFFRAVIFILIILSMAGMSVNIMSEKTQTMFIADGSASIKNKEIITEFINNSFKNKPENEEVGFLSFGENISLDKKPSFDKGRFEFGKNLGEEKTNIEQALSSAMSAMNKEDNKRLVLISDGGENVGDSLKYAEEIKEKGVVIDTYYVKDIPENEVQLSKLTVSPQIGKNSKYNIEASIYSTSENSGNLIISKEKNEIYNNEVQLKKGENKFIASDIADIGGLVTIKAEIKPQKDTYENNNVQYSCVEVKDMPRLLIIENKEKSGELIYNLLKANEFKVDRCFAGDIYDLRTFSSYQAVIIADCSYKEIGEKAVKNLKSYVKDSGGGLLVTGGENSFGLGEYEETELEKILPVNMQPIDKTEENSMSMIVVLDRSGSMQSGDYGVTGLLLAKNAVLATIDELKDKDSFGVIAFDDAPTTINELQRVEGNKEKIKKNVENISLGGGTSIIPALEEAVNQLKMSKDKYKHIILLTDGQGENNGYSGLEEDIKNNGITLSSVAVGSEADIELLKALAKIGGGRYYYTDEFSDLPNIFVNETKKASKEFINEKAFYPKIAENSELLNNIEKIPMLKGYISASLKADSELVLRSEENEPVLAFNQYGLGKSGVFMVDVNNWCDNWFLTPEGTKIFLSSVSKVIKNENAEGLKLELKKEKGKNYVLATLYDNNISLKSGKLVGNETEKKLDFRLISANEYRAEVDSLEEGFYTINALYADEKGGADNYVTYAYVSWSPEYDFRGQEEKKLFLEELSRATGGKILTKESSVFDKIEAKAIKSKNLSNILMTSALILFIIDIGIKRFKRELLFLYNKIFDIRILKAEEAVKPILAKNIAKSYRKNIDKNEEKEENKKSTAEILALNKKKREGR